MDISREANDFNRVYDKWLCTTDEQHICASWIYEIFIYIYVAWSSTATTCYDDEMMILIGRQDFWMQPLKVCKLHASYVSYVRPKHANVSALCLLYISTAYILYAHRLSALKLAKLISGDVEIAPESSKNIIFFYGGTQEVYITVHTGIHSLKVYRNIIDMQRVCRNRSCELGCFTFFFCVRIQKNSIYWNVILL